MVVSGAFTQAQRLNSISQMVRLPLLQSTMAWRLSRMAAFRNWNLVRAIELTRSDYRERLERSKKAQAYEDGFAVLNAWVEFEEWVSSQRLSDVTRQDLSALVDHGGLVWHSNRWWTVWMPSSRQMVRLWMY